MNSLFLEAPLKRPPHLNSPIFFSVPASGSLLLPIFFAALRLSPRYGPSLPASTCSFFLSSISLFLAIAVPSLRCFSRLLLRPSRERIRARWKKLESNGNGRTELILRARKAKGGLSSFTGLWRLRSDGGASVRGTFATDCQISGQGNCKTAMLSLLTSIVQLPLCEHRCSCLRRHVSREKILYRNFRQLFDRTIRFIIVREFENSTPNR